MDETKKSGRSKLGVGVYFDRKKKELIKKRKEASEKPRKNLKKRSVTTGTGRQGAGPFPFKKGGRS